MVSVSIQYFIPDEYKPGIVDSADNEVSLLSGDVLTQSDDIRAVITSTNGPISAFQWGDIGGLTFSQTNPTSTGSSPNYTVTSPSTTLIVYVTGTVSTGSGAFSSTAMNFTNSGGVQFINTQPDVFNGIFRNIKLEVPQTLNVQVGDPWPVGKNVIFTKASGSTFTTFSNDSGIPAGITFDDNVSNQSGDVWTGPFNGIFTTPGNYTVVMSAQTNGTTNIQDNIEKSFQVIVAAPPPIEALPSDFVQGALIQNGENCCTPKQQCRFPLGIRGVVLLVLLIFAISFLIFKKIIAFNN